MVGKSVPFESLLSNIVDNRGRTCPTATSGLPLIATNCIRNDLLYPVYENVRFVDDETYRTWFRGHPEPGDLLFVTKGTPGRVCLVPDPVDFCIAQDMVAIRADPAQIYPRFLFALLRSEAVQERILQLHVGTLIPHFKKGDFDKLYLSIPDEATQKFTGDIYFYLSSKIDLNRRRSRTLESMARAHFQSWFVDFDPVKAKAAGRTPVGLKPELSALFPDAFSDSELGPIPNGWRVQTVGDVATINAWTLGKRDELEELDYIEISEVMRGEVGTITRYLRGTEPGRARRRLRHGDTAISTVRPDRGAYFLAIEPPPNLIASTGFAVLTQKVGHWAFLHVLTTRSEFGEELGRLADGGAYPAVRPEVIAARPTVLPDNDELLIAFEKIAQPMFLSAEKSRQESRILGALRDSLLSKLISGEVRVPVAERIVGEIT